MTIKHINDLARLRAQIREVPDFPTAGIRFLDVTPVLADRISFASAVDLHLYEISDIIGEIDLVVGIEARGFWFGPTIADRIGVGFVPVRKPGKLPAATVSVHYSTEYSSDTLQLHVDAIPTGARVLVVDDLLATGGTAAGVTTMIESLGAEVIAQLFMIELVGLGGRARQGEVRVDAMLTFAVES